MTRTTKSQDQVTRSSKTKKNKKTPELNKKSKSIKKAVKPKHVKSEKKSKIAVLQDQISKLQKLVEIEEKKINLSNKRTRNIAKKSDTGISKSTRNTTVKSKLKNSEEVEPTATTSKETAASSSSKASKQSRAFNLANELPNKRRKVSLGDSRRGERVVYIHVGEGGERDLHDHLRGDESRLTFHVLEEEALPDLDCSDLIEGLDHHGTRRDYVDDSHRCSVRCPVGCQGHLRPNEAMLFAGFKVGERLVGRTRLRGRFVTAGTEGCEDQVLARIDLGGDYRRLCGGRGRRREEARGMVQRERTRHRRWVNQQRFQRTMEEDRNESPIPPVPTRLGEPIPQRIRALLDCPPVDLSVAMDHGWNSADRSYNVELKEEDPLVMRRRPVAQSTDCIRSKTGYTSGLHLFELTWPARQRGTHAVVGVATAAAPLHVGGYQSLVGSNGESWGWDLGRKKAFHEGVAVPFPASISHHHQWTVPDTFHMVLDMDRGQLSFLASGELLGASHTNLPSGQALLPVVNTVWGHCEVKLQYMGSDENNSPPSLQELARGVIKGAVSKEGDVVRSKVEGLGLPKLLQNYLLSKC